LFDLFFWLFLIFFFIKWGLWKFVFRFGSWIDFSFRIYLISRFKLIISDFL